MKIGLPRSFVYYANDLDWETFFQILGHEVVYSTQTTSDLLTIGQRYANNEDCLPLKQYYGHIIDLADRVDYIFIPQLVSLKKGSNCCPKVIASPMLMRNGVSQLNNILIVAIDSNRPLLTRFRVTKFAAWLAKDPTKILKATNHIMNRFHAQPSQQAVLQGSKKTIGLLGHRYTIYDEALNLGIIDKIHQHGYEVTVPSPEIDQIAAGMGKVFGYKPVHWDCGQRLVDTAGYYYQNDDIIGVITLSFFGCGIDAFVEEVYKRALCEKKPYLTLTLDEHTGEAGMLTRLEAFLDMMTHQTRESTVSRS